MFSVGIINRNPYDQRFLLFYNRSNYIIWMSNRMIDGRKLNNKTCFIFQIQHVIWNEPEDWVLYIYAIYNTVINRSNQILRIFLHLEFDRKTTDNFLKPRYTPFPAVLLSDTTRAFKVHVFPATKKKKRYVYVRLQRRGKTWKVMAEVRVPFVASRWKSLRIRLAGYPHRDVSSSLMSFSHRTLLPLLPIPPNYIVIFHIVNWRRHRPCIDRENFMHAFFWSVDRVTHSRATASGQLASSVILSNYHIRRCYFSTQHDTMRCTVSDFTNLLSLYVGVRFVSPQFVCLFVTADRSKFQRKGHGVFPMIPYDSLFSSCLPFRTFVRRSESLVGLHVSWLDRINFFLKCLLQNDILLSHSVICVINW